MRFYLASRFSRHPEMREIRDRLVALGHTVTSHWIDRAAEPNVVEERVARDLDGHPEASRLFASEDVTDIINANTLVFFTPPGGGGRGGRHVEFGIAYALRM